METFIQLFGSLLSLVYHCFDRLVILAYLPLLTRAEHVVYLFRDVNGISPITPEVLRQRTTEYRRWVESFVLCHALPIEWAEKGVKKEDQVRPYLQRQGIGFHKNDNAFLQADDPKALSGDCQPANGFPHRGTAQSLDPGAGAEVLP